MHSRLRDGDVFALALDLDPACLLHLEQSRADRIAFLPVRPKLPDDFSRGDPGLTSDDLVELLLALAT